MWIHHLVQNTGLISTGECNMSKLSVPNPKISETPKRVAIIGGNGNMGSFFKQIFLNAGIKISITDKGIGPSIPEIAKTSDVVMLCVPIDAALDIVRELGPQMERKSLLCDVTSVKVPVMEIMLRHTSCEVVGAHPLFGPESFHEPGLKVALCPGRGRQGITWLKCLLEEQGLETILLSPEQHDRAMSIVQGLNYISTLVLGSVISRLGSEEIELLESVATKSFAGFKKRLTDMLAQPPWLFGTNLFENPFISNTLDTFEEELAMALKIIRSRNRSEFNIFFQRLRSVLLGGKNEGTVGKNKSMG